VEEGAMLETSTAKGLWISKATMVKEKGVKEKGMKVGEVRSD